MHSHHKGLADYHFNMGYSTMWCNKLSPRSTGHPRSHCGHQQQQIIAINISSRRWQWGMTWCSSGKIKISRLWQIITQLRQSITAKGETQRESSWQGSDISLFVRQLVEFELLEKRTLFIRGQTCSVFWRHLRCKIAEVFLNCSSLGSVSVKWPGQEEHNFFFVFYYYLCWCCCSDVQPWLTLLILTTQLYFFCFSPNKRLLSPPKDRYCFLISISISILAI